MYTKALERKLYLQYVQVLKSSTITHGINHLNTKIY